ncbi:MAG: peptide ABC transporter substrate-binding protein [Puniceicoccales bacterium]|jgi:oligopeptide transport system substrate-binding protein|nr:peptide ABC transporter substrate-binding protein [Puniceicoccales bacterium]
MKRSFKIFLFAFAFIAGCRRQEEKELPQPQVSKVLKIGSAVEAATLDPQLAQGLAEEKVISGLFEGLLVADGHTLQPVPGMAQSYTVSEDGREYRFFLRDHIFWSNGDPVVAEDFVNTLKRGLSEGLASPWVEFYFVLKNAKSYYDNNLVNFDKVGIEALSPKVLKFTLEYPIDYFPALLTHWAWSPVHRKSIEHMGRFFDRDNRWTQVGAIVSNGPYCLKSAEAGSQIVLQKNEHYWDAVNVAIDCVHFISGVDASTEENMFITEALHITDNVPMDKIKFYQEQGTLQLITSLGSFFYWFNCQKPPYNDVRVRKALSLAVEREAIENLRKRGPGFRAYSLVPPGTRGYEHQKLFQEDVDYARQLLAEAGYPNGENFPISTLTFNGTDTLRIIAEAVQEMWRRNLNIEINLQSIEWNVFLDERRQHKFDIIRGGWIGDYNDATTFLNLFHSKSENNHAQWFDKTVNEMLQEATQETDPVKRAQILAQAEALIIEQMPIIPLYYESICHLVSPSIGGWDPNILDWHPLKFIYFKK